jgi:prepilin-type N-terminal cleavage/methylation domain-containing protein
VVVATKVTRSSILALACRTQADGRARGSARRKGAAARPPARSNAGSTLAGHAPQAPGFTVIELMVTLAVLSVIAAVTVPSAAHVQAGAAARAAAQRLALVLRAAQAQACADGVPVEVLVDADGAYEVAESALEGRVLLERGVTGARSATNYPGGGVEFSAGGWPCSLMTHVPRAGSFTFSAGFAAHSVTLQMGGRIRWQ